MTDKGSPDDDFRVIERLDAGEPASSPEEAHARAPYERLVERIRNVEDLAPPAGWEARAAARWSAAKRKRRLGIGVGVGAALGLAAVLLLQPCATPGGPPLELAVLSAPGVARRGDPAVGDLLQAQARVHQAHVHLRLYLETRLIAQCPGSEGCRRDGAGITLDWKLAVPGVYQIIVISSDADLPEPGNHALDRDLLDARNAGWSVEPRHIVVSR